MVRALAREEARNLDDGYWLALTHEGSDNFVISELLKDILMVFQ